MLARGARKFVFVGRSGIDSALACRLVELSLSCLCTTAVRENAASYSDIEKAVASMDGPIGGVVQASSGLDVSFPSLASIY